MPGAVEDPGGCRPDLLAAAGRIDRDHPDRTGGQQRPRAARLGVGLEGAGQAFRPAAVDHHRDLAAQVQPREIVMPRLGQVVAIADEDERGVDPFGRRPTRDAEDDVAGHSQRRVTAVRHQSGAGGARGEAPFLKAHRLKEGAVLARRLKPERGKAPGDQIGSAGVAGAAGLAALHVVGSEGRDRRPPGFGPFGLRGRCAGLGESGGTEGGEGNKQEGQTHGLLLAPCPPSR